MEKSSSAASVPGSSGACGGTKIFGSTGLRARGWAGSGAGFGAGCSFGAGADAVRCRKGASVGSRISAGSMCRSAGGGATFGTGAGGAACAGVTTGAEGKVLAGAAAGSRIGRDDGRGGRLLHRRLLGPHRCRARFRGGAERNERFDLGRQRCGGLVAAYLYRCPPLEDIERAGHWRYCAPVIGDDAIRRPGGVAGGIGGTGQPFAHAAGVAVLLAFDAGHQRAHARREAVIERAAPAPCAPRSSRARRWR